MHKPHLFSWEELINVVNVVEVLAVQRVGAGAHLGVMGERRGVWEACVTGLISLAYLPDSFLHFGVVEDCLQLAGPVCKQLLRRALSHRSVRQRMI